ncbi:MAG: VOC family protein [Actinobacteria bacterium]|nr:VOC family protein [Actinomycetota bacterium]
MVTGIHHFSIACSDAERSIAFYRDHFGMELVADREVEPGGFVEQVTGVAGARVRIVHLRGHGLNFELLEYAEPRGDRRAREPNHTGAAHLCFATDDIEADLARLAADGVPVRSRDRRPVTVAGGPNDGGKCAYLEDPDGNCVELVQLVRPWPSQGGG